ncbi:MAG: hypothetical protein M3Y87_27315, partial [Myxococcota bacterium]|nr:hypothetical protein [Myxococcota bacterium]
MLGGVAFRAPRRQRGGMAITKADVGATLGLLRHYGYTVEVTPNARGRRVVLRFGEERWEATGASTAETLDVMLAKMLPSAITRSLFATALKPAPAAQAEDRP